MGGFSKGRPETKRQFGAFHGVRFAVIISQHFADRVVKRQTQAASWVRRQIPLVVRRARECALNPA